MWDRRIDGGRVRRACHHKGIALAFQQHQPSCCKWASHSTPRQCIVRARRVSHTPPSALCQRDTAGICIAAGSTQSGALNLSCPSLCPTAAASPSDRSLCPQHSSIPSHSSRTSNCSGSTLLQVRGRVVSTRSRFRPMADAYPKEDAGCHRLDTLAPSHP